METEIVPDTKDWTWVLDQPCPEDGSLAPGGHHYGSGARPGSSVQPGDADRNTDLLKLVAQLHLGRGLVELEYYRLEGHADPRDVERQQLRCRARTIGRGSMATLEELERRVNELEERLDRERRTTLQALGETQSDHGRALRRIENAVSGLTTEMGNFHLEMGNLHREVRTGFEAIGAQLDRLIANDQGE